MTKPLFGSFLVVGNVELPINRHRFLVSSDAEQQHLQGFSYELDFEDMAAVGVSRI